MKRILSGITPSGDGTLHIGNYLGAVSQFIELAKTNECFLFVSDLHALTTIQDKKRLESNIAELICQELALLGENANITFFRQSDVPLHAELQTVLNNVTPLGLLRRAHAYKDKLEKDIAEEEINMGLFSYPILMAADILLYKPDSVPVGKDQKQHIEIARDIAGYFNKTYKTNVFKLPEPFIPENVATILGTDGKRKMSKSLGNVISIFEADEVIKKQVMGCYTDPTRIHADDPGHIEGNMVFAYLDHFGEQQKVEELKSAYAKGSVSDVEVKDYLFSCLMNVFAPARARYQELKNSPERVKSLLASGAKRATEEASKTMMQVRNSIGLTTQYSFFSYPKPREPGTATIDDFASIHMDIGTVESAEVVVQSEKLNKLFVDFGGEKRTIYTAVRKWYPPEYFVGKSFFFVTNLPPRNMPDGGKSEGMIMAVDGEDGTPMFVPTGELPKGSRIH